LKILIIGDYPVPSIYKSYRADPLAKYLASLGHEVTVLCPHPPFSYSSYNQMYYKNIRVIYSSEYRHITQSGDLLLRSSQPLLLGSSLHHLLKTEKFDVIRAVSFVPSYVASLLSDKYKIPLVVNLSDFYSDLYSQFGLPLSSIVAVALRRMEKRIAKISKLFIVDSPAQRDLWSVQWGLDPRKCVVVPDGINLNMFFDKGDKFFDKSKIHLDNSTKIVYFQGDISYLDGIDLLVDSASYIIKKIPVRIHYLIVGHGTKSYMNALFKKIEKQNLTQFFSFTGWVPHLLIPSYLRSADICVAPFRLTFTSATNFPNKIKEYIVAGKPIIATESIGLKETVGNVIHYFKAGDSKALAQATLDMLEGNWFTEEHKIKLSLIARRLDWINIVKHEERLIRLVVENSCKDFRNFDYKLVMGSS